MRIFIFAVFTLCSSASLAWLSDTSDDKWRSGFGQGICEAEVTNGSGNNIYVACDCGSNLLPSSLSITLAGNGAPSNSEVLMIFDGGTPISIQFRDHKIEATGNAQISTFYYVIEKLRKHSSVYIRFADGRESKFTLRGSSKALSGCQN